jgi:demethylmenaquinone methyltransferase/2-methoxy-6-polyprenyl-1,4-benzoquinol methylase
MRRGPGVASGKVVPKIGGVLSAGRPYRYLPRSLSYLPPPAEMLDRLRHAGFTAVTRELLTGGAAQLITATRTAG